MVVSLLDVSIFQGKNLVLDQVNLEIMPGTFNYLVGKTGSGKSSLLKTLYAALPVSSGKVSVAGFEMGSLNDSEIPYLRRKLGIVFQDFQLLTDRTVFDNLEFVLQATGWTDKQVIKNRTREVLDLVGLGTKYYKMPHELSGGEQQRVVIARALLNKPELILADEPTANLDPEMADEIMKLLHDISDEGTAVLLATHDYRIVQKFNGQIFKCEDSRLIEVEHL
ncbi:MAG: ATP-binding cassette domain-containing protein [Bacteroidota bacterium]|nr:ATP-binding cassette domain-containing protein [Bacteroidota bacterium]